MPELNPDELTSEILALIRDQPYTDSGEHPIWRWQRWIHADPEQAWQVFEQVVRKAPNEPDVLESVRFNLEILLYERWDEFATRATALVRSSPLLDRVVGPEILTREHYGSRYRTLEELAAVWVHHDAHADASHRVLDIVRKEPEVGLRLALEIIERGPLHGFETEDLHGPLLDLVRHHGPHVIDQIETAARDSVGVRRVLWDSRRLNSAYGTSIPTEIWNRLMQASGGTNLYNSAPPHGSRHPLEPEWDQLLDRWFTSEESFWAWSEVSELVRDSPATGWLAIQALVRHATTDETLGGIGAGPLEDLLRKYPADFVEQVEVLAAKDSRFRMTLGCVWLCLEKVPEDLARRYWRASERKLSVLDAPPGWATSGEP